MKSVTPLLLALICVGYVAADFADLSKQGLITPINLTKGDKLRDYTPFVSPMDKPTIVGFYGELASLNSTNNTNSNNTNSNTTNPSNQTNSANMTKDALVYLVDSVRQFSLQYAYFRAQKMPQNESIGVNVSFAMLIRYFYLVEFNESNGTPGFQLDDKIISTYNLSDPNLKWNLTLNETSEKDINGTQFKLHWLVAKTSDEVFAIRFLIAGHPINESGYEIRPDESKFDIRIRWYNNTLFKKNSWTTGPSNNVTNSKLALIGGYGVPGGELRRNDTVRDVHNSSEILFDNGTFVGFFRWSKQANITNSTSSGNSSLASDNSTKSSEKFAKVLDTRLDQNALGGNSSKIPIDLEDAFLNQWKKEVIAIAFDAVQPKEILLDPQFGVRINYTRLDQQ